MFAGVGGRPVSALVWAGYDRGGLIKRQGIIETGTFFPLLSCVSILP